MVLDIDERRLHKMEEGCSSHTLIHNGPVATPHHFPLSCVKTILGDLWYSQEKGLVQKTENKCK